MENKIVVILEIIIVFGLFIFYILTEAIPDYKKSIGSSDKFINTEAYEKMYEFNIDNKINFSIIIDKNNKIYHMLFFNRDSAFLANKNIENNELEKGIKKIYVYLLEHNLLNSTSNIDIIKYNDKTNDIYNVVSKLNNLYNINAVVNISESTIKNKVSELKLDVREEESYLKDLDLYSKEFIRLSKNIVLSEAEILSFKNLSDNVYAKISNYISMNGITDLSIYDTTLVINMIPADDEFKYYPSINSWYYVNDKKVYAYIEFVIDDNNIKGYCYNGSIDLVKEGVC